jgi:hypothetical protein
VLDRIEILVMKELEQNILRDGIPVSRQLADMSRMTAQEALGDIYATLDDAEGKAWLRDARESSGLLAAERRDPWA